MKLKLLAISLLLTFSAYAQDKAGNGGDVVYCPKEAPVILDYYQATQKRVGNPNPPRLFNVNGNSYNKVLEFIENTLKQYRIWSGYSDAKNVIGEMDTWIEASLPDTHDSNEVYHLQPGCYKRRAATRQDETMYGNGLVIADLNEGQKALLVAHERLYYLAGTKTSEHVRELLSAILNLDTNENNLRRAMAKLCQGCGLKKTILYKEVVNVKFAKFTNDSYAGKQAYYDFKGDGPTYRSGYHINLMVKPVYDPSFLIEKLSRLCPDFISSFGQDRPTIHAYPSPVYEYAALPDGVLYFKSFQCILETIGWE